VYQPPVNHRPAPRPPHSSGWNVRPAPRHTYSSSFSFSASFGPSWYAPTYYYPSSGFYASWSGRRWGIGVSFWPHTPVYYTPYYDTWAYGGWGYTRVYSGGWQYGWYGGASYFYDPWPVYRTVYLDPPTETVVYVTQPATTTVIYEQAPAAPAAVSQTAPILPSAVPPDGAAAGTQGWDDMFFDDMFPPIESVSVDLEFASYAETLDRADIWVSYAGLDRLSPYAADFYAVQP
jgi:hypothetical protein